MQYRSAAEARHMSGVRLALTAGVPGPWSMSAKAILKLKGIAFVPVEQVGGGANEDLVAWTGHRNAPVLVDEGGECRTGWLEILKWAERVAPTPALLPRDAARHEAAVGLADLICGEDGYAWSARLFMLDAMVRARGDEALANPMVRDYGYDPTVLPAALERVSGILDHLSGRLNAQQQAGSPYFVGSGLTAVDVYWAYFSQLLDALPDEISPTPLPLRKGWGAFGKALARGGYEADPILIRHRDLMFERHLPTPLEF